jgi:hypothetical protein
MRKHPRINRVVIIAATLLLLAGVVTAEELVPPYETYPEALGGFFGPFSGSGLHYHRWLGQNGFHVSGGVVYAPIGAFTGAGDYVVLNYSLGGEFQRRVFGAAFTDWLAGSLYLFAGGMHRGFIPLIGSGGEEIPATDPVEYTDYVEEPGTYQFQVGVGVGIGIELILFRHFSIPVEFGYGATWTATEPVFAEAFTVGPNVQSGLRYRY